MSRSAIFLVCDASSAASPSNFGNINCAYLAKKSIDGVNDKELKHKRGYIGVIDYTNIQWCGTGAVT
jgi:hypothetical protein